MKQAFIYNDLVRFYNRSRRKLQSLALEGKNLRKQNILQKRITRLFKILTGFQHVLKLGMTTAALSAGMLLFQPNAAQAQISFGAVQTNPFGLSYIGYSSTPAFADLDGDGDMDLIAGEYPGNFIYFQNTGTATAPAFAAMQTNPFGLTYAGNWSAPTFADLDGDGDLDLMSGEFCCQFVYFQNIGTATTPVFAAAQINPFGLTFGGINSVPTLADVDGDGDLDLMVGDDYGDFGYFQNIGTVTTPLFDAKQVNPFGLTNVGTYYSAPTFADLDGDGDLDLMSGDAGGNFDYFKNIGTATAPAFAAAQVNSFGLVATGGRSTPTFADLDGDGDMDLMVGYGRWGGNFYYFQNYTICSGLTVFADADGDDYGDAASSLFVAECIVPAGYVIDSTDCNDNDASIHPGECDASNGNGVDDNCDGFIDNGFGTTTFYGDGDGDGFGDPAIYVNECSAPQGYVSNNTDCDDDNAAVNPSAIEVCNSIDDNCNGSVDEGVQYAYYYADVDGDGYGNGTNTIIDCAVPDGYVTNFTDCNDANASVHPGVVEVCSNGVDDNCNGVVDEGCGPCIFPANLSVTNITGTSAKLKWDGAAGAEGYAIQYKTSSAKERKHATTNNTSKAINGLLPNTKYKWKVKTYCRIDSPAASSAWSSMQVFTTGSLKLGDEQLTTLNVYPNPFESSTTILFSVAEDSRAQINLYDVTGKLMQTVLNENVSTGDHTITLDRNHLIDGIYLLKLQINDQVIVIKVVID